MDAISDPKVGQVVIKSSSQVGKSEIILCVLGFFVVHDPAPVMLLQPTLDMAESFSKDRIAPMIRDTPCLQNKFADPRSRDSGNTLLHKKFPGGHITLAGANSPASLASRPIRVVLCDEIDRYPISAGTEGDPVTLVVKRSTTFHNAKVVLVSTPTTDGASRIDHAYESSDQSKYFIPCQHCQTSFVIEFEHVKWREGKPIPGQDGRAIRTADEAWLECPHCQGRMDDTARLRAVREGYWESTQEFRGTRGFWIWEAYSPWSSLLKIANGWLSAQGRPEQLKAFRNTTLGLTYRETGEAPDDEKLLSRCEPYQLATVPDGVLFLTAGADVQQDRIEIQVVGWGRGKESWLVDYQIHYGDTAQLNSPAWTGASTLLDQLYWGSGKVGLGVNMLAVDSGYNTQVVYAWARQHGQSRVMVVKGEDKGVSVLGMPSALDVLRNGKRQRRGMVVWPVNVSKAKGQLYGWLRLARPEDEQPFPPGWCHFPVMPIEFFRSLTAEQYVFKIHKGFRRGEWVKVRERNEVLDTRVYALAAAVHVGLDKFNETNWHRLESYLNPTPQPTRPPKTPADELPITQAATKTTAKRRGVVGGVSW